MAKGDRRSRKILIVGGAGGVGSSLARALCESGKSVIVCDNVSTGSLLNIEDLYTRTNFEFIREDIADMVIPRNVGTIVFLAKPDKFDKEAVFNTHMDGLRNCLDHCSDNVCKIIYASTPLPLSALDGSKGANSFYLTRQVGESLVADFYQKFQIGSVIMRMPSVYGDRPVGQDQLVWKFIEEAVSGGTIKVVKDQNSTRAYVHIDDFVGMCIETISLLNTGKLSNKLQILDINSPDTLTAGELAEKISSIIKNKFGKKSAIVYKGRRYGHKRAVSSRVPSPISKKARKRLSKEVEKMIEDEANRKNEM